MVKKYAGGKATTTRTRKEKKNWWPHLTSSSPEAKVENLGFAVKRYPLKISISIEQHIFWAFINFTSSNY